MGAKRMRLHGYDCVDYSYFSDTDTEFFRLDEKEFQKWIVTQRGILEAEGITIYQTHGPWRYPPDDTTIEVRKERFDAMSKAIRGSAYLGAKTMVIHPIMPFGARSAENPEEVKKINFEFMNALCDVAKEYGIIISYENMPFPLFPIHTAVEIADFARMMNRDNFKVCLDTGHTVRCGDDLAEAVRYIGKDLLCSMHVHDNYGDHDTHNLPGDGIIDWDAFAKALADIRFDGVLSLETYATKKTKRYAEMSIEDRECMLADWAKQMGEKIKAWSCEFPVAKK